MCQVVKRVNGVRQEAELGKALIQISRSYVFVLHTQKIAGGNSHALGSTTLIIMKTIRVSIFRFFVFNF